MAPSAPSPKGDDADPSVLVIDGSAAADSRLTSNGLGQAWLPAVYQLKA